MAAQAGQDAKFFQRGKIQVRAAQPLHARRVRIVFGNAGIPRRAAGSRGQRQEVYETEDRAEEDRGQYHNGKRQYVNA